MICPNCGLQLNMQPEYVKMHLADCKPDGIFEAVSKARDALAALPKLIADYFEKKMKL